MRVRLHPDARAELREARRWYYERSPLSATAFAHAVDNAVSRIVVAPAQYPSADHGTRKLVSSAIPFQHLLSAERIRDSDCRSGTSEAPSGLLVD
jgi:plasmid stabilization system protein ParE